MNTPQPGKGSFSQSANLVDKIGGMGEKSITVFGFRQPSFFNSGSVPDFPLSRICDKSVAS